MNAPRRTSAPAAFALVLGLVAPAARSQDSLPPTTAEQLPTSRDLTALRERNREMLHPADPLRLIGHEQEGNDLRRRAPGLKRTDGAVVYVDQDEAYRRKLALYAERATFHDAVPSVANGRPGGEEPTLAPRKPRKPTPVIAPEPARSWAPLWIGLGALALAFAFRSVSPRLAQRLATRASATRRNDLRSALEGAEHRGEEP